MGLDVRNVEDYREMMQRPPLVVSLIGRDWLDALSGDESVDCFPEGMSNITFQECGTIPKLPAFPTNGTVHLCFYNTEITNKAQAPRSLASLTVNGCAWPFSGDATTMSSLSLLNYVGDVWPALPADLIQLRVDRAPNLPVPTTWVESLQHIELEGLLWTNVPSWPEALRNLKLKELPVEELPALPGTLESFEVFGLPLRKVPVIQPSRLVRMLATWQERGQ